MMNKKFYKIQSTVMMITFSGTNLGVFMAQIANGRYRSADAIKEAKLSLGCVNYE